MTIGPYAQKPYDAPSIFNVSAMSYGALSKPAVLALSHGSRMAGNWLNTGEGGLSPWHLEGGADIVFQIGTAKYGVRNEHGDFDEERLCWIGDTEQVRMIEIKLSQGAKPGKGGIERGIESAPDFITVDSGDGGTGAAPMSLIDNVGLPINESLPLVVDKLKQHGLRDRVRVIASGKLVNSARGFMIALGCIQALQCNKNT